MKVCIQLAFIVGLMSSCSVRIKNFDEYQKAPLLQLERMPTKEELAIVLPRIVVTSDEAASEVVKRSNAENIICSNLISILEEEKFANIVERERSEIISKEIAIAEMEGKMMNIESVNYVVKVVINDITFSSSPFFIPATKNRPARQGYRYSSHIDGVLKVYSVPTMKIVKTIRFQGRAAKSEDASSTTINIGRFGINAPQAGKDYDSELIYKAVQKAVRKVMPEMKSFLKKKAYIMEKRVLKEKAIFAINRGYENGIRSQNKLLVSRQTQEINPLTQEEEVGIEKICRGIVAKNTLEDIRAWVVFDEKCHKKLRLGDEAYVQYK